MKIKETSAHFIGVGGVGMSALAELFNQLGAHVSGSDIKEGKLVGYLRDGGVSISIGHSGENITDKMDVIVCSSAIDESNPEVQRARALRIPIIHRAEALAEIMRFKRGIAVGGTHGKTTTTSMISSILLNADKDPTIAVGGRLKLIESTARLGQGPWMVAEADESDGSFSRYNPEVSIITNIDSDHLDHFKTFENLQKAFLNFALNVPYYGTVVIYGDDPKIRELFAGFSKKHFFYGTSPENDFVLKKSSNGYEVFQRNNCLGELTLQVPGLHNALNALAACIASHLTDVSWEKCIEGANLYSGVDRRFQKIGESQGVRIFDDYAHHPTEIGATIQACQELDSNARLHLVYQPHRFTRTRDCWQDYLSCFKGVHQLYLTEIYPAGESPIDGVTSEKLSQQVDCSSQSFSNNEELVTSLSAQVKPGDLVMTMGAGNVWQLSHDILKTLSEKK